MKLGRSKTAASLATLAMLGAACGSSSPSSASSSSSSTTASGSSNSTSGTASPTGAKYTKHVTITWWTWTANANAVVANFEKHYPTIKVLHPTVAAGHALYSKLTTALAAGSGAPDLTQIEYDHLPQFTAKHSLVNIAKYVSQYKSDFPSWVWNQVSSNGAVYAFPEDIGPMGLIYRPNLLKKYKLPVPSTYATFATDAVALHKADPSVYMTYFPANDGNYIASLFWQAGAQVFHQSSSGTWTVAIDSATTRKVINYWGNLIKKGAIPESTDFAPAWESQIGKGMYASYLSAAWSPTYEIDEYVKAGSQHFAVTHMPEWSAGHLVNANWGGSTNAVTKQAKHPRAAALLASFIDSSPSGLQIDEKPATKAGGGRGLFPADIHRASVPAFSQLTPNFVTPNVNAVYSKYTANVDEKFQWSPWTSFFNSEISSQLQDAISGKESFDTALKNTQAAVVKFAQGEGFTVHG